MDETYTVRVEPSGIEFEVGRKETVFSAAARAGLHWPTICYGQVRCTACALRIIDGRPNTVEPTTAETTLLRRMAESGGRRRPQRELRLACQLKLRGDITVHKSGVRPATDSTPVAAADSISAAKQ